VGAVTGYRSDSSGGTSLPPGQQLVARDKWPVTGERAPRAEPGAWTVFVTGLVDRPQTYTLGNLRALPLVERTIDLHCVTRWSKPRVAFRGVELSVLLAEARPLPAARFVCFAARSERGHDTSLPLDEALSLGVLLALEAEDRPLASEHGGPVRCVTPGRYFYKSLKWLERIELLADDRLGFWERTAGYHNEADPWRQQRYIASQVSKAEAAAIVLRRDVRERTLLGLELAGRDLAAFQAQAALLRNANFTGCRLPGANFDGANLSNARFSRADLRRASFRDADLEGADFAGADLRGVDFRGAALAACTFVDLRNVGEDSRRIQLDSHTRFSAEQLAGLLPEQRAAVEEALARLRGERPASAG
jgi:DMSO/TMAO reductase YedYZ molybdopterin-dependent catalytic subunit